jgi:SAM-dependent methyltransferase
MDDGDFLQKAYRMILRRPPDEVGVRHAMSALADGSLSRSRLVANLTASPEFAHLVALDDAIARGRAGPLVDLHAPPGTDERSIEIPWALSRRLGARRLLDAGYAHAPTLYLEHLTALDSEEVVGVDLTHREVPGVRSVVADLRRLPFNADRFDLVLCVSTLEHVGSDNEIYGSSNARDPTGMQEALREFRRVVTDDGRIVVTVPAGLEEDHGWFIQRPPTAWLKFFRENGLDVAEYEIYELGAAGWGKVHGDPPLRYGERGPAASAVLCAVLAR